MCFSTMILMFHHHVTGALLHHVIGVSPPHHDIGVLLRVIGFLHHAICGSSPCNLIGVFPSCFRCFSTVLKKVLHLVICVSPP